MPNITSCSKCHKLYEAGSEEQANEPIRFCPSCREELKNVTLEDAITSVLDIAMRRMKALGIDGRQAAQSFLCIAVGAGMAGGMTLTEITAILTARWVEQEERLKKEGRCPDPGKRGSA